MYFWENLQSFTYILWKNKQLFNSHFTSKYINSHKLWNAGKMKIYYGCCLWKLCSFLNKTKGSLRYTFAWTYFNFQAFLTSMSALPAYYKILPHGYKENGKYVLNLTKIYHWTVCWLENHLKPLYFFLLNAFEEKKRKINVH